MTHLEVTRTGRVLAGLGYAFHYNLSNSYGETVMRHFVTARFAAALPGDLTLAARGELLLRVLQPAGADRDQIAAGNTFSSFESIEDENRSSAARRSLARSHQRAASASRATPSTPTRSSTAPAVSYRRQTLLVSLVGTLDK